jgi:hypothetical protein
LEEYDGSSHDVLSDKLDILKPTIPAEALSPRHSDNNEDRVDDGDDLEEATRSILKSTHSSHSLSAIWICQLSGSRTSQTASLCHFSFVQSTISRS